MLTKAKVTLPDREELLKRLRLVSDNAHFEERFFPLILKHADTEKVAMGVVMLMELALHDYLQGMPPQIEVLVRMDLPRYYEALAGVVSTTSEVAEGMLSDISD